MSDTEYRFTVRPLSEEEGGGWLVEYPDLPGCMSDGEVYVTEDSGASWRKIARQFGEIRTAIWVPNWIFIVVNKKPRGRGIANADCGPLFRGPIAPGE